MFKTVGIAGYLAPECTCGLDCSGITHTTLTMFLLDVEAESGEARLQEPPIGWFGGIYLTGAAAKRICLTCVLSAEHTELRDDAIFIVSSGYVIPDYESEAWKAIPDILQRFYNVRPCQVLDLRKYYFEEEKKKRAQEKIELIKAGCI